MTALPICERLRLLAEWKRPGGQTPSQKMPSTFKTADEAADIIETLFEAASLVVELTYLHDLPPLTVNAINQLDVLLAKIGGDQ